MLDLGIYIDSDLSMRTHVQRTASSCFAALRQLRQIRRLVPTTDGHIPDADGRSRQPTAALREQHAGWNSSLPHEQIAVSSERCGTAHLPSQALQSRHGRTRYSTSAACTGANPIQDHTYRVLHGDTSRYIWGLSPADVPGRRALRSAGTNRLVVPPARLVQCPPSAAELSRSPPLKSGTLYRNTSYQFPRCSPSGVT